MCIIQLHTSYQMPVPYIQSLRVLYYKAVSDGY